MNKILILFFILFSTISSAQTIYPKLVISDEGDSLVLQTIEQTRNVSKVIEVGKACELSGIVKDSIIGRKTLNEKHLNEVIVVKNEIITSKDSTISDKDKIITSHVKINDDLKKDNKSLKIKNTIILIGSGILTTLIVILALR